MTTSLMVLTLAVGYGLFMKVADLYNEHGLKGPRHVDVLFGLAWGVCGASLVWYGGPSIANIICAMNLAMVLRGVIDRLNHHLATVLIVITFIFSDQLVPPVFLIFLFTIWFFGAIKDQAADRYRDGTLTFWIAESMLYYPLPTLIYSVLTGEWIVFWVFLCWPVAYNIIKIQARKWWGCT